MQAVRMDILKNSSDPRCSRLYDRLLANQSQWSRQFPPAVEHACAATVVEANSSELTTQKTCLEPVSRRKRILNIIAEIDTESQLARLRQLAIQGRWLEWTDAMHSDLSWRRLIHGLDDGELQFNLRVISNTLPTPDNLRRWGQNEVDPACPLCGRPATLRHILNSCSVALHQGRYTWRHDSVLEVLQRHLTSFWKHVKSEPLQDQAPFIRLVKEGAPRLPCQRRNVRPLLSHNDSLWHPLHTKEGDEISMFGGLVFRAQFQHFLSAFWRSFFAMQFALLSMITITPTLSLSVFSLQRTRLFRTCGELWRTRGELWLYFEMQRRLGLW